MAAPRTSGGGCSTIIWRAAPIAPRVATEVHGDDLAAAVRLALETDARGVFNVSDLLLDRHDLLARVQALTGCPHPPPPRAAGAPPGAMATDRLRALGWRPGGTARLDAFFAESSGREPTPVARALAAQHWFCDLDIWRWRTRAPGQENRSWQVSSAATSTSTSASVL